MIFGGCPYCDKTIINYMPEPNICPALFQNQCEACGETYWIYASRAEECKAYTQEQFDNEFELDEKNKKFQRKQH